MSRTTQNMLFPPGPTNSGDDFGDYKPLAHGRPPSTSHDAVKKLNDSGQRQSQNVIALSWVRANPNKTADELMSLCRYSGCPFGNAQDLRKRLNDLLVRGLARQTGQRECAVRGNQQNTWEAV